MQYIEFWDFGEWNEYSNTRRKYKKETIEIAQKLNKETSHEAREGCFEGHRFRIRKAKEK